MPNNEKRFSWKERAKSFTYAWDGILALLKTEHNTWIHLSLAVVAIITGIVLKISRLEFAILILVISLVWVAEIFNTCIEKSMDFISLEKHPQIKVIKDMAAAAVWVMAIVAVIVGCLIFIPKLL